MQEKNKKEGTGSVGKGMGKDSAFMEWQRRRRGDGSKRKDGLRRTGKTVGEGRRGKK